MAEELPGFIPRVLQRDDVSLLRADEAVLKAMVDGWRAQMLARGLATSTITARCKRRPHRPRRDPKPCSVIGRFVEFANEYPWRWRPLDLDQFLADLRSRETPIELSTLRRVPKDGVVIVAGQRLRVGRHTPNPSSPSWSKIITSGLLDGIKELSLHARTSTKPILNAHRARQW